MRPLRLKLEGLRSYRKRQEIDFTGVTLMAIVGDTGAGKSSILEAICFALYGSTTFDGRSVKQLIADGSEQMRVELTFLADGKKYRVTRATSRTAYPPPMHQLEGLDDATRIDNESAVTERIKQLVGLDFDAFQRAVVLPQGRFQALLQATERERASILKGILRLDVLDQVRESARELEQSHRPKLTVLKVERAKLLEDPVAEIEKATVARQAAEEERSRLEQARRAHDLLTAQAERMENEARRFEEAGEKLSGALRASPREALRALVRHAADLERRRQAIAEARKSAEEREKSITRDLVEAGNGASIAEIVGSVKSLEALLLTFHDHERNVTEFHAFLEERELRSEQQRVRKEALPALEREATAAAVAAVDAAGKLIVLAKAATTVLGLLDQREKSSERANKLRSQASEIESRIQNATQRRSSVHLDVLADAERRAEDHLEHVQRGNAAAHAAAGCAPGDPCPVCGKKLSPGFVAPRIEGEADARQSLEAARALREKARTEVAALEATISSSTRELEHVRKELDALIAEAEKREQELVELAPDGIEMLHASMEAANEEKERTERRALELDRKLEREREAVRAEDANLERSDRERETRRKRLDADAIQLVERGGALQVDLTGRSGIGAEKGCALLEQAIAKRKATRDHMHVLEQERLAAAQRAQQAMKDLAELAEQARQEIESDHRRLAADLLLLRDRAHDADALLRASCGPTSPGFQDSGGPGTPAAESMSKLDEVVTPARMEAIGKSANEGSDLLRDAADAERLEHEASSLFARIRETSQTQLAGAGSIRDRRDKALHEEGVASVEALVSAHTEAAARALTAEQQRTRAERERPLAAKIDHALRTTEPVLDGLKELASLLADAKFIAFVVEQRQRSLLAIASEILSQVTGGRFGFSETFKILDRGSGQPREVKTLSGGETFLASLALALALVELAGRSGGRLDALFLDEGFGTLDANCLNEALDALGRQAESGRLVAVISHLQAVTESIDRVLYVTRESHGSAVRWLDQPDREALGMGELHTGLLH